MVRRQVVPRTRIQFDPDVCLPVLLGRFDKGAADIFVLCKTDRIGDPGGLRIADRRVQTGIRHADHHVRLDRVLFRQKSPGLLSGQTDACPVNDRIRPRKINVFKDAEAAGNLSAVASVAGDPFPAHGNDLTGENIPVKDRTDGIQPAAFRGKDDRAVI